MELFAKHAEALQKAVEANHTRAYFSLFPEHPSPAVYGETADADGLRSFESKLGKQYVGLDAKDAAGWAGAEVSPYTGKALGVSYPVWSVDTLVERAKQSGKIWKKTSVQTRAAVLMESLDAMRKRFFEVAYATMHTTGQGYMMAFQASGPHAADRALEAIAMGYEALQSVPSEVLWDKPAGKFNLQLKKHWHAVPKGINVVIGCATFPTWNSVPGVYAGLITGNPVIVKPHPMAILPMAIFVEELQHALQAAGLPTELVQLAVDTPDRLVTKELAEHPEVRMLDFTGSAAFGNYLEGIAGKVVFTEKTGVNSIILDSTTQLDKALQNLAFSVSLYSGQMCTAPQNIYIPAGGVQTPEGIVAFDEVAARFADAVKSLYENPKAGPFVLGAIQNPTTLERITNSRGLGKKVLLESTTIPHPQFPEARTATPLVLELDSTQGDRFATECFGPIVFLIKTKDTAESIQLAHDLAIHHGALSCGAYTTDPDTKAAIIEAMGEAATTLSFNLHGGVYVNQNAAFSDFHGTGGNPAANASFTNSEFVTRRFTWVGYREGI
jgi:phenylacetic acid degradation protein paaN